MFFGYLRRIAVSLTFAWLLLPMAVVREISALEPATPLGRLGRQAWTIETGLPQNTVPVLLQSRDGFLWAGTELGLARFDGVSFRVLDHAATALFPDAEIRCLLDANGDGGLWIGTGDGLVLWKNGKATLLTTRDGLPGNSIRGLAQTSDGAVWVWTEAGLAHWDGRHLQAVTPESGWPGNGITSLAADMAGGLWVGTAHGAALFREGHWHAGPGAVAEATQKGASRRDYDQLSLVKTTAGGDVLISNRIGIFLAHSGEWTQVLAKAALPADGISFLDRLADGTVVVASKSSVILAPGRQLTGRPTESFTVSQELPGSRIESMYIDREGCVWLGTNRGLARISSIGNGAKEAKVQLLPPTDPLASNAVVSLLEDREGDLWVGTETAGLHILRDARFRMIGSSDGLTSDATTAVVQDARETLWIGTPNDGLNRVLESSAGKLTITGMTTANGLLSSVILSLAAAPDGDVWVGTPDGLNRIGRNGISSFTSADGLADDFIRSVLVTPDGSVWVGTRRGLTHMDHGHFQSLTQADGLGSDLVGALARTLDGDLWIATLNGLSRLHQGQLKNYTTADGLSSNVITALDVTSDGTLWIGTQDNGVNLWDGKRFLTIPSLEDGASHTGLLPAAIHAITHDDRGHLWLASGSGLTRVDLQPLLECALQAPQGGCSLSAVHLTSYTTADGLRSRETSSNSHPTACRASDGKLWFTTPRGVIVADPLHFPANPTPPPVAIERFAVDDHDVQSNPLTRIEAGALRFQFDYAGLSFAAPQKLRYQYMLEGFDRAWTNAGTRRTAYYTNIPFGKYRFRVRATLGDSGFLAPTNARGNTPDGSREAKSFNPSYEAGAPQEALLSFELLPHFYQTIWFRALAALMIVALTLLAFRRRVIRVEREFRAVMAERNRIAREIHDTLAQGYVGISLQLEILGELLRHSRADAAQKHLALTQELVREGLDDARQSIWALRSHDAGEQALPIRLRRLVEQAADSDLTANLEVHGAYRALTAETEQEILRIAQEAIHNVKRHAGANRLNLRIDYGERTLALSVADDGKGFAAGVSTASPTGHYGLTGMRERAALIRAEIEILSEPGMGTTVRLKVPAPEARNQQSETGDPDAPDSEKSKEQL
jgi:ligand-binding sensor domain-containing protein/signal transduction histidine kinase